MGAANASTLNIVFEDAPAFTFFDSDPSELEIFDEFETRRDLTLELDLDLSAVDSNASSDVGQFDGVVTSYRLTYGDLFTTTGSGGAIALSNNVSTGFFTFDRLALALGPTEPFSVTNLQSTFADAPSEIGPVTFPRLLLAVNLSENWFSDPNMLSDNLFQDISLFHRLLPENSDDGTFFLEPTRSNETFRVGFFDSIDPFNPIFAEVDQEIVRIGGGGGRASYVAMPTEGHTDGSGRGVAPVPAPAAGFLLGGAILSAVWLRRRQKVLSD